MLEDQSAARATRPVSRRTLAAGVAWSAPAVWVASAAPAMAASPDYILQFVEAKYSGAKGNWIFSVSVQNQTGIQVKVTQIKITAPFGWTFTYMPNKTINAGSTLTMASSKQQWDGKVDADTRARWGAGPCTTGAIAGYCKSATCLAATDTCNCGACAGTCHGPCAIFAMQGSYVIQVTFETTSAPILTWTVIRSFAYPNACGNSNNNCTGLAANVP